MVHRRRHRNGSRSPDLMLIVVRYVFWLLALFFALIPALLPLLSLPADVYRLFQISRFHHAVPDLVLACITICIVALIDALESVVFVRNKRSLKGQIIYAVSLTLLCCVVAKLFLFSYWYSTIRIRPDAVDGQDLWIIAYCIGSCAICSFGCRTAHLFSDTE